MFFLTGKEGLVLKTDCGPILLYVSEEEKKKKSDSSVFTKAAQL